MRQRWAAVERAAVIGLLAGLVAGCGDALLDEVGSSGVVAADGGGGGGAHDGDARDGSSKDADAPDGDPPEDDAGAIGCPVPLAPVLSVIDDDEVLTFTAPSGVSVELAVLPVEAEVATAQFSAGRELPLLGRSGLTRVLARAAGCAPELFSAVYDVRDTYAPSPPALTTTAVRYDDPRLVGWATGVESYAPGSGIGNPRWMQTERALGPAGTDTTEVVTLGDGGRITLVFDPPITDGDGWDFAVFENSFAADTFLELGFVEVSSDGVQFLRFDSAFRGAATPCASCSGRATELGGLAGAYPVGYGTPFDLAALANFPAVRDGTVDLGAIRYVRVEDIIGDGTTLDSFGRGIVDPLSGGSTAGFDLDAIGVLHSY